MTKLRAVVFVDISNVLTRLVDYTYLTTANFASLILWWLDTTGVLYESDLKVFASS